MFLESWTSDFLNYNNKRNMAGAYRLQIFDSGMHVPGPSSLLSARKTRLVWGLVLVGQGILQHVCMISISEFLPPSPFLHTH